MTEKNSSLRNQIEWILTLETETLLHIGERRTEGEKENNELEALTNKSDDKFVIPGSSIRGVFQNYISQLELIIKEPNLLKFAKSLFGESGKDYSVKGKIWIGDTYIPKKNFIKNMTPIDRILHKPLAPLKIYGIPPKTIFSLKLILDNANSFEIGIVALFLKALLEEKITFGSGGSRGLGIVSLKEIDTVIHQYDPTKKVSEFYTFDGYNFPLDNEWEMKEEFIFRKYQLKNTKNLTWMQPGVDSLSKKLKEAP